MRSETSANAFLQFKIVFGGDFPQTVTGRPTQFFFRSTCQSNEGFFSLISKWCDLLKAHHYLWILQRIQLWTCIFELVAPISINTKVLYFLTVAQKWSALASKWIRIQNILGISENLSNMSPSKRWTRLQEKCEQSVCKHWDNVPLT